MKIKLRDLTPKQYAKWFTQKCRTAHEVICGNCPMAKVTCTPRALHCWVKHKDLFDDKFLDQEIEFSEE